MHVCVSCVCLVPVEARRGQLDLLELELQMVEPPTPSPVEEQPVLLSAEPSIQSLVSLIFVCSLSM